MVPPPDTSTDAPSKLVRDELFESGSPEFVTYLRLFRDARLLAAFADRWALDARPEARAFQAEYAALPLSVSGHEPIVKRLFKHAEAGGDHEAVAWWAHAFDRLIRRKRVDGWHYDYEAGESYTTVELRTPRNRTQPNASDPTEPYYWTRKRASERRLFTYATRHYLNRRAWRYLRTLGYGEPKVYIDTMVALLARYVEDDLAAPEHLLDSRTLMHACFHESEALEFSPRFVRLKEGRSLSELKAAPYHGEHWHSVEAFEPLLVLLEEAQATVPRVFAMTLLEEHHPQLVPTIDPRRVLRLMGHPDPRVQEFAVKAFGASSELATLDLDVWLELLNAPESPFLAEIVAAFKRHVDPARVGAGERWPLAQATPAPVAALGFELVQESHGRSPFDRHGLARVAEMRCGAVAGDAAEWAVAAEAKLPSDPAGTVEFLTVLFDARLLPIRRAAMDALVPGAVGWNEPLLWTRLVEAPYDDVRFGLLGRLEQRGRAPGGGQSDVSATGSAGRLEFVWTSIVLSVHRGSRWKPRALEQIVGALLAEPSGVRTEGLLSVIGVAVRSIRLPERRAGLAAVARLLERAPELQPQIQSVLPELSLDLSLVASSPVSGAAGSGAAGSGVAGSGSSGGGD